MRILSACLRVAESLDRSRHGVVKDIELRPRGTTLRVQVAAIGDSELEVWAATRQLAVLAGELDRELVLVARHLQEPDVPVRKRRTRTPRAA